MTKRLLAPSSLINTPPKAPPTPPPDVTDPEELARSTEEDRKRREEEKRQWREEALLDFAGFEGNIARVHFLLKSNELERERYAAEKERIVETARSVRENNASLHLQLQTAQQTLATRKTYDQLADRITSNRALKPRDEQQRTIEKLQAEIAELEQESQEYAKTWGERREQFGKIVDEGRQLLRLIRDEKEEAERHEDLDAMDEEDQGAGSQKIEASRSDTPNPAEGQDPLKSSEPGTGNLLPSSVSRNPRAPSPQPPEVEAHVSTTDTQMADAGNAERHPTQEEEGEVEEGEEREKMDTS